METKIELQPTIAEEDRWAKECERKRQERRSHLIQVSAQDKAVFTFLYGAREALTDVYERLMEQRTRSEQDWELFLMIRQISDIVQPLLNKQTENMGYWSPRELAQHLGVKFAS